MTEWLTFIALAITETIRKLSFTTNVKTDSQVKKLTKFLKFIANLEFKPRSKIFLKLTFSSMPCCPNTTPSRAHWQMLVFPTLKRFKKRTTGSNPVWGYPTRPFLKKI